MVRGIKRPKGNGKQSVKPGKKGSDLFANNPRHLYKHIKKGFYVEASPWGPCYIVYNRFTGISRMVAAKDFRNDFRVVVRVNHK